jgi:amidase
VVESGLPGRIVVSPAHLGVADAATAEAVRATIERYAAVWGAVVTVADVPWERKLPELLAAFRTLQSAQAWRLRGAWIEAHPGALAPDVEGRFRHGATVTPADEATAAATLASWRPAVDDLITPDTWLALPAAGGPGHPRGLPVAARDAWRSATLACAVPAAAFGLPSVSLPAHRAAAAVPVGVALVAPARADAALLTAAKL